MDKSITIRPARIEDIDDIVTIHIAALAESFLAQLGSTYLRSKLYPKTIAHETTVTLIASNDTNTAGFIQLTTDSAAFEQDLKKSRLSDLPYILSAIARSPWVIKDLIAMLFGSKMVVENAAWTDIRSTAELFTIAVHPDFHRRGVGQTLVAAGLQTIFSMNPTPTRCIVKTHTESAAQFYENCGFARIARESRGKTQFIILGIRSENHARLS